MLYVHRADVLAIVGSTGRVGRRPCAQVTLLRVMNDFNADVLARRGRLQFADLHTICGHCTRVVFVVRGLIARPP